MDLTPTQLAVAGLRDPEQDGMGRVFGGKGASATDRLSALDKYTDSYRTWSPALISGLLQTTRYTAGAIKLQTPSLSGEEVERRVKHPSSGQRTSSATGPAGRGPSRGSSWERLRSRSPCATRPTTGTN